MVTKPVSAAVVAIFAPIAVTIIVKIGYRGGGKAVVINGTV